MESHDAEFSGAGRGWARKPNRFHATPAEIDAFLREHFAEDTLLRYQWAIGDAAAHEAAEELRVEFGEISAQGRRGGWHGVQDFIDTAKGAGHYPSSLINFEKS